MRLADLAVVLIFLGTIFLGADCVRAEKPGALRMGFTLQLSIGAGFQTFDGSNETGLSAVRIGVGDGVSEILSPNLGVGMFINPKTAVLLRFSGVDAEHDVGGRVRTRVSSGVGAVTIQRWIHERVDVEGGVGLGYQHFGADGELTGSKEGLAVYLGTGFIVFNRGQHNVYLGLEYVPVFVDGATIHNMGWVVGYQLF